MVDGCGIVQSTMPMAGQPMKRIVLTGGPGAGKTCISSKLATDAPQRYVRVAEAATQVYAALKTRWDRLDTAGRRLVQRKIYDLQRLQEEEAAAIAGDRTLLLDRGTIDGAAYWPDGPEDYWRELATDPAVEMARYDAVIWLESCAAIGLYDGEQSNACRHEDEAAALELGRRLHELWSAHPRFHVVRAMSRLEDKVTAVRALIEGLGD